MGATKCMCPLCGAKADASDINHGKRARIYCSGCSAYDITEFRFEHVQDLSLEHRQDLIRLAKNAPAGKILVITRHEAKYEDRGSKVDRPAPDWLQRGT